MTRWVGARSDQEILDDLLAVYEHNGRDKLLPITVAIPKKVLARFAECHAGTNEKMWMYRGWLLKNVVG